MIANFPKLLLTPLGRAFLRGYIEGFKTRVSRNAWHDVVALIGGFHEIWPYALLIHAEGVTLCVRRVVRWDWFVPWSSRRIA